MTKPIKSKHYYLSERKFRDILKACCIDPIAKDTAILTGISRYTIKTFFEKFRYCLVALLQQKTESIEDSQTLIAASRTHQKKAA